MRPDVLRLGDLGFQADVVFSIGLIEHFDPAGTRQAIEAHFALLKPGGYAIISYPTPTWLYRAARTLTEAAGLWKFHDEHVRCEKTRSSRRDEGLRRDRLRENPLAPRLHSAHHGDPERTS